MINSTKEIELHSAQILISSHYSYIQVPLEEYKKNESSRSEDNKKIVRFDQLVNNQNAGSNRVQNSFQHTKGIQIRQ